MVLKSTPVVFIQLFVVFIFGEWPNINTLVAFFNTGVDIVILGSMKVRLGENLSVSWDLYLWEMAKLG